MKKTFADPVVKFFLSVIGMVVIFIVLKDLKQIFIPLIIAYFLFFVFEPLNRFLTNKKVPSGLVVVFDLIILISILWGVSEVIINQFRVLGNELPLYEQKLNNIVSSASVSLGVDDPLFTNFQLTALLKTLDYGGIAGGFFSSTISIFSNLIFILLFFLFIEGGHSKVVDVIKNRYIDTHLQPFLKKHKKRMKKNADSDRELKDSEMIESIKVKRSAVIENTFKNITEQVQKYIFTKFLISVATGGIVGAILALFGIPFVLVWTVLTILFNFIPTVGSIIAVILPALMTLVHTESFTITLVVAGLLAVSQNLVGNLLEPKIMGNRLGLNPLVILISLLLWGYIWGIPGMFLSVPLTAVIKIIMANSDSASLHFISDLMSN